MTVRDISSRKFLIGIVIGVVLGGLLAGRLLDVSLVQQAQAQIPDAGAQRNEIRGELTDLNSKMDELITLLKSGKIKAICAQADDKKQE